MRAVRSSSLPVPADSTSAVKSRRPCASASRRKSSRHAHNSSTAEGPENRTSRTETARWPAAAAGAMRARHSANAVDFMSLELDVPSERSAVSEGSIEESRAHLDILGGEAYRRY